MYLIFSFGKYLCESKNVIYDRLKQKENTCDNNVFWFDILISIIYILEIDAKVVVTCCMIIAKSDVQDLQVTSSRSMRTSSKIDHFIFNLETIEEETTYY